MVLGAKKQIKTEKQKKRKTEKRKQTNQRQTTKNSNSPIMTLQFLKYCSLFISFACISAALFYFVFVKIKPDLIIIHPNSTWCFALLSFLLLHSLTLIRASCFLSCMDKTGIYEWADNPVIHRPNKKCDMRLFTLEKSETTYKYQGMTIEREDDYKGHSSFFFGQRFHTLMKNPLALL